MTVIALLSVAPVAPGSMASDVADDVGTPPAAVEAAHRAVDADRVSTPLKIDDDRTADGKVDQVEVALGRPGGAATTDARRCTVFSHPTLHAPMESPNRTALDLVDEAIDFADELRVDVHHLDNDAVVLDFGVEATGGFEAGLLLAEVATGGLATVQTRLASVDGAALTAVECSTDHPALALLGCQRPGWPLQVAGDEVDVGGPAQLLLDGAAAEPPGDADFAVATVGTDRLPGAADLARIAKAAGVSTSAAFSLVAPENSVAGAVAAAARAGERAVSRVVAEGADPDDVTSVSGVAPVAPLAPSRAEARARSAAAIALGGRAHLVVDAPMDLPDDGGRGEPAPAQVTIDVAGGPTHAVGSVDERQLAEELGL